MKEKTYTIGNYFKFIISSLLGVFLLMITIPVKGEITLVVAIWADFIDKYLGSAMPTIAVVLISISFFVALFSRWMEPRFIMKNSFLKSLFFIGPIALTTRGVATVFAFLSLLKLGPEWLWSDATGGNILFGLLTTLVAIFFFAGYILPLLLDFGLLELFGTIMKKIMRPIFTLPGRSSIDSLVSWLGDGTIGVMLTNKQYEEGYYTKREAAVIGTTFSLVSIDFTIVVLLELELEHMFIPYYSTIIIVVLVAALIMPRIPPLSKEADTLYETAEVHKEEIITKGKSLWKMGFQKAAARADNIKSIVPVLRGGTQNVGAMWF